jgi:sodium transport system ATP-binding protein
VIEVINLVKRFGRHTAVDGLSFSAADGAITGLLGANGAGKTTSLAIIAGVLAPDSGSVVVEGGVPGGTDRPGALLDQRSLYSRLTVRENIAFFAGLRGMSGEARREAVDGLIDLLGLARLSDRRASRLSEGERMKVALARAMVHGPRNLLLDEPTNGLDVAAVRSLRHLLRDLRDRGHAILFSSHVVDEVRQLCDRVVVIDAGRLVAEGTIDEVCRIAGAASLEDGFVALAGSAEVPA